MFYFFITSNKKSSNPSECQIFHLFRCVLSSLQPLRSVGRSNFDKGLHNLITLIKKRHKLMIKVAIYIYICTHIHIRIDKYTLTYTQCHNQCGCKNSIIDHAINFIKKAIFPKQPNQYRKINVMLLFRIMVNFVKK